MKVGVRLGSNTIPSVDGRDGFLDATRGVAMAGIVLSHVTVGVSDAEIGQVTFGSLNAALYLVHVPLFAFVSGLMLGGSASRCAHWLLSVNKLGSLLWLYLIWTAIQGTFELLANSIRNNKTSLESILDLWTPIGHLWFLTWLTISTAVAFMIRPWQGGLVRYGLAFAVAVVSLLAWGYEGTTVAERGIGLIGIFVLGASLTRQRFLRIASRVNVTMLAVITFASGFVFALVVHGTHFSTPSSLDKARTVVSVTWGSIGTLAGVAAVMALVLVLVRIGIRLRLLQWIGRNTLPIFLLHIIFAAGTRVWLLEVNLHEAWIHVGLGTLAGIFVPLFLSRWLQKVPGLLSAPWSPSGKARAHLDNISK